MMIESIKRLYNKLSNLGYKDSFDEIEKTNNLIVNQIQIYIVSFIFLFVIGDIIQFIPDFFTSFTIFLIMLSFFFIRSKVSYLTATLFQTIICVGAVSYEFWSYNMLLRVEPLYIVALVLGMLLLPQKIYKITYVVVVISLYLGIAFYVRNVVGYHETAPFTNDNLAFFLFAAIIVGIVTYRYSALMRNFMVNKIELVESLRTKNEELERFAYITSHDLKQPLRNIGSFAGLLRRFIDKPNREEKNLEYLNEIENSANRMNSLIEEILSFSKIDKIEVTKEKVDLDQVMENFKRSHSEFLKETQATINYSDLPTISGNKLYLSLLFQNLVENGIKYNTSKTPIVTITSKVVGNDYVIKIEDNGIGISEEFRASIFEPFKRLHSNRVYEGTGLGLSICMKIVETHDGKIWVENNDKDGSTFAIRLPISAQAS